MDKLIGIFQQLGVDESIFIQFVIFSVFFVVLKMLLFNKLLFVLQLRESKTTKLDGEANEVFSNAEQLANKYYDSIKVINEKSQNLLSEEKNKIKKTEDEKLKEVTNRILSDYETKKSDIVASANKKAQEVMSQTTELSDSLTSKFIN